MVYEIRYGTGAGDETVNGTLDQAMQVADKGAAYTQADIKIMGTDGDLIAMRRWIGVKFDPDTAEDNDIIGFGDYGYFDAWTII